MYKFIFLLYFLFTVLLASAQDKPARFDNSYRNISFETFVMKLNEEQNIRVFYRTEWVKNIIVTEVPATSNSLLETLQQILYPFGLQVAFYQDYFVVMPGLMPGPVASGRKGSLVVIGNPLDEGKFEKATLRGVVTDGKTGEPIPGAQIICEQLQKVVSTDRNGLFSIEIPVGRYRLKFSFIGLDSEMREVMIYGDGKLAVELYEKSIALGQINVMSERPVDNYKSTSMGMVRLNGKSIKRLSVMMGEADVMKSMTMLPGVQSTGENASGFNVRGGNIDQNLILVHEATVYNTSHLFGLFSMLDANLINDVTFYKSGIPAQYGGRISSVMDIELRKGNNDRLKVSGGVGIINSRISVEGPLVKDKLQFIAGMRTTYSDWMMKILRDHNLRQSSANFSDFHAKLDYTINSKNRISVFGYGSNDYFDYYRTAEYGYGNFLGAAKWNHLMGKTASGVLHVSYSRYKANLVDYATPNFEYDLKTGIADKQLQYNVTFSPSVKHTLSTGLSFNHYGISPGNSVPHDTRSIADIIDMDRETSAEGALFFEDNIELSDKLALIAGIRYSAFALLGPFHQKTYESNFPLSQESVSGKKYYNQGEVAVFYHSLEPRVALRYQLQKESSVKIGYNRTVQYIRQISNSASITPADYWKASDPYLKPLVADQIAAGYFRNFLNDKMEVSFEVYSKTLANVVDYKNGAKIVLNNDLEQVLINGEGRAYGAELMVKKPTGRLNGWLSYTYSRSFIRMNGEFKEEKINDGNWYRSNYDKPHDFTLTMNYHISRKFTFSSNFTYSTGRPATFPEQKYQLSGNELVLYSNRNEYRIPDYHRLDASITYEGSLLRYQKWRSSWTFAIYNVYGRHNPFSVYYSKQVPSERNNYRTYALYTFSVMGVPVPSFTYNFWF